MEDSEDTDLLSMVFFFIFFFFYYIEVKKEKVKKSTGNLTSAQLSTPGAYIFCKCTLDHSQWGDC